MESIQGFWIRFLFLLGRLPIPAVSRQVGDIPNIGKSVWESVPTASLDLIIGNHRVCHAGYWDRSQPAVADAETAMLDLICTRAGVRDWQRILDYRCEWGALSLWMATRYPNATIVAATATSHQKRYIDQMASRLGIVNITSVLIDHDEFRRCVEFDVVTCVDSFGDPGIVTQKEWAQVVRRLKSGGTLFLQTVGPLKPDGRRIHRLPGLNQPIHWMVRQERLAAVMATSNCLNLDHEWWLDGQHFVRSIDVWRQRLTASSSLHDPITVSTIRWWLRVNRVIFSLRGYMVWGVRQQKYVK